MHRYSRHSSMEVTVPAGIGNPECRHTAVIPEIPKPIVSLKHDCAMSIRFSKSFISLLRGGMVSLLLAGTSVPVWAGDSPAESSLSVAGAATSEALRAGAVFPGKHWQKVDQPEQL